MQTQTANLVSDNDPVPFPYELTFVDCEPSAAVRFQVESHLKKLARLYNRITDCKVTLRIPHKHRASMHRPFHVHISLDLPGKRLAVSRDPEEDIGEITSAQTAISAAFQKLARQLNSYGSYRKS